MGLSTSRLQVILMILSSTLQKDKYKQVVAVKDSDGYFIGMFYNSMQFLVLKMYFQSLL